jgi:energy-coupling factor transport system permease protein
VAYYARHLLALLPIVLLIVVSAGLSHPGHPVVEVGVLTVTREGACKGAAAGFRLVYAFFALSLLTLTTPPGSISQAMAFFLSPLGKIGLPVAELAVLSAVSLSYLPLLMEDARRITDTISVRGAYVRGFHLCRGTRSAFLVLNALLGATLRRAEDLATAMEIRCYRVGEQRTSYRSEDTGQRDVAVIIGAGLVVGLTLFL